MRSELRLDISSEIESIIRTELETDLIQLNPISGQESGLILGLASTLKFSDRAIVMFQTEAKPVSLFGDFNKFLEDRLDEFLQNNPHLELQVLDDELRDQEADTVKLIAEFERKEKQLEAKILETAESIQLWHGRAAKARQAGRSDLAEGAAEREAALLREGNQLWAQRKAASDRLEQAKVLQGEIRQRRQALKVKAAELKAQQANPATSSTTNPATNTATNTATNPATNPAPPGTFPGQHWDAGNTSYTKATDPLEQAFVSWEMDDELEELKRQIKP